MKKMNKDNMRLDISLKKKSTEKYLQWKNIPFRKYIEHYFFKIQIFTTRLNFKYFKVGVSIGVYEMSVKNFLWEK